ncbi:response regulator [candidate division WWE3 bacterium]|uniref:Response regulator n=1 Tax=candidate division WWE3 bacterium TaxID=2053526 RepID=A0A7X9HHA6_UNCKA|nr:response regulator [candidate division WWE3 bacterium]
MAEEIIEPNQPDSGKTVLVVEDDNNFVRIINAKLGKNGIKTLVSSTASGGLQMLEQNKVDLIWLDHYLVGEQTGYDFVAAVKKDKRFNRIPIFLVTNYDDYGNTVVFLERLTTEEKPKTYLEYGIDKYFVKSNTSLDTIILEIRKKLGL